MKKIITLIAISLLLLSLSSCRQPEVFINPWEDPALSERDAAIRTVSDAAIMQKYSLEAKDIYLYEITINSRKDDGFIVYYKLCFFGYDTYEHYWVNLSPDYTLEDVTDSELGVYSKFISSISEDSLKTAEKYLDEQLEKYEGVSDKFLTLDDDGNLCLTVEVIEPIDPPLIDESGNSEGCGLDHKHTLITAVVCEK